MAERAYEMLWDCGYCGAVKLLAKSQRFCPKCGAPQDTAARYFPDEADKVEAVGHRYEGADKICPACEAPNGALAEFCGRCGAPLSEAAQAKRLTDQVRAEDGKFAASLSLRKQEAAQRHQPAASPPPLKRGYGVWIAVAVLALVGFLAVFLFWTRTETVTVSGHYWRQAIQIERYGPVSESAWCEQVPGAAYAVSRHSEIRSYRQVADGQECQVRRIDHGDGTFSEKEECHPKYRSEPVYDQRCDYRIDRWQPSRMATAEGYDLAPRWPSTGIGNGEREGPRETDYEVLLKAASGQDYRCDLPLERWRDIQNGSRWSVKIGVVGGRVHCDSLQPIG